MQLSEAQIFTRDTNLPDPTYPVPINTQMFTTLPNLIRGRTQEQHHKLAQLAHYNIAPVFYTCHNELATIPDNIQLDKTFGLLMFQGFGG